MRVTRSGRVAREQLARPLERGPTAGTEQAVPPNLGEAARQRVLEKARQKGVDGQRDGSRRVGARVGSSET